MVTSRQWASRGVSVCPARHQGHLPWSFLDWQFRVACENLTNSLFGRGCRSSMEPFWYENLPDKGCQLCLPQLEGLRMQLFEPCRPSPKCLSFDLPGHDKEHLAPFFHWVRALTPIWVSGAGSQTNSVPKDPMCWVLWMESWTALSHVTAPQGQRQKCTFLILALCWLAVVNHRLPVQKHTPVNKAWVQKGWRIHCAWDICAQPPLHGHLLGLSPRQWLSWLQRWWRLHATQHQQKNCCMTS